MAMTLHFSQIAGVALAFGLVLPTGDTTGFVARGDATTPPLPAGISSLDLKYDLSISIFGLGKVDVASRIENGQYQARSTLDTNAIISIFWAAHIEAASEGSLGPGRIQPAKYDSRSRHREKRQSVTVLYGPHGPTSVAAVPPYTRQQQKYHVTEEQRRNTVDPLSAMVFIATGVTANAAHPCGATAPVYDGRRRYDIQLSYLRTANIKLEGGAYNGPALVCQIKYIQIAGFKQKIIAEGKRLPPMFAYMVPMPSLADPSRRYLVPVRLWAETGWGTAEAIVQRIQLDGHVVAMAK
jgi:hypothetical protein